MRTDPTKAALDALTARVAALEAYNVVTDYGNGWYGKPEAGGKVHIWKDFSASGSSAWGNLYEVKAFGEDYPFTFDEVPEIWATSKNNNGGVIFAEYTSGSKTAFPGVWILRPNSSSMSVTGTFHAIGTPASS